jgi:hypothetical protein
MIKALRAIIQRLENSAWDLNTSYLDLDISELEQILSTHGWHLLSESEPPKDKNIIFYFPKFRPAIAFWNKETGAWNMDEDDPESGNLNLTKATHWMLAPEPPEVK